MQMSPLARPAPDAALVAPSGPVADRRAVMMEKARALEAGFLSEMLGHAGVGGLEGEFSGGIGEDQFASFLRDTQAQAMVDAGGIGLAEKLFLSMARYEHAPE